jgi:hypothetical protein
VKEANNFIKRVQIAKSTKDPLPLAGSLIAGLKEKTKSYKMSAD